MAKMWRCGKVWRDQSRESPQPDGRWVAGPPPDLFPLPGAPIFRSTLPPVPHSSLRAEDGIGQALHTTQSIAALAEGDTGGADDGHWGPARK